MRGAASRIAALALCSLALVHCATTPEPAAELTPPPSAEEGGEQAAALTEARRQARVAVARAVEAGAETYAPVVLREARDALQEGARLRAADPEGAAEALERARSKAEAAYRNSLGAARQQLRLTIELLQQELRDHQADQFAPEEYAAAAAEVDRVEELFAAGSLVAGDAAANAAIRSMRELRDSVAAQLARVLKLKGATEALQDQVAGAADADAVQAAAMNDRYAQGREALEERYALAAAERHFAAAEAAGGAALGLAAAPAAAAAETASGDVTGEQVEALLRAVMAELESASLLTVITDAETVVDPAPWQGAPFLSGDAAAAAAGPPAEAALESVPQHELLQHAKAAWLHGVARRDAGDYGAAAAAFEQARRAGEAYAALAVMTTYTVRLIPGRRESLWRIAGYDFVYGDPRLWRKIWERNRELIEDPDLILPGWHLYIPPAQ